MSPELVAGAASDLARIGSSIRAPALLISRLVSWGIVD
ncbi:hypothetical protein I551_4950 [Mycobacterium ulcerans str. Harvey]|uniref:Uncharacterized protein n=1 Tax=Mycobacterium ulcerans str. Harvey TaxID=1299332 RepID=A0ABN0QUZ0_MYCUL|nr:hypothetical protein I551_4950 [Mycobacterium ulcerans str. Harvey]